MRIVALVVLAALLGATGCQYPRDPEGTLDAVKRGQVLRVAFTVSPPWVEADGDDPSGIEPALVERFAKELGADIVWEEGSEADNVEALEHGRVDLVIGGWEKKSPYKTRVSPTRPYYKGHVMAVRLGENAMLVALERSLLRDPEAVREIVARGGGHG